MTRKLRIFCAFLLTVGWLFAIPADSSYATSEISATVSEGKILTLSAPSGFKIDRVVFASYGTPANYTVGKCHAINSISIVEAAIKNESLTISATNDIFGDPCSGTFKYLSVILSIQELQISPVNPIPEIITIGAPRNLSVIDGSTSTVLSWDSPNTGTRQPERYAISFNCDKCNGWGIATGNVGDSNALNTSITISHSLLESLMPSGTVWSFHIRSDNDTLRLYSENSNVVTIKIGKTSEELAAEQTAILAEQQRLAAEAAAKKAEEDRIAAELAAAKAEEKRLAAEAAAKKAEEEAKLAEEAKLKSEAEAKAKAEEDARLEAERIKAEQEKLAAEKAAKEKEIKDLKAKEDARIAEEKAIQAEKDKALSDAQKAAESGKELNKQEKAAVAEILIEKALESGQTITASQIASSGIEYKDLPPDTPVEVRTSESGEALVITAEVAANVALVTDAGALLDAVFTDPGAALQALGSIGADMTPGEREEATKMVVATVVATGAAMNAVGAATSTGGSTGGNSGGSGGGGASSESKGVRRRKP